jgi:hypothetical protein
VEGSWYALGDVSKLHTNHDENVTNRKRFRLHQVSLPNSRLTETDANLVQYARIWGITWLFIQCLRRLIKANLALIKYFGL